MNQVHNVSYQNIYLKQKEMTEKQPRKKKKEEKVEDEDEEEE